MENMLGKQKKTLLTKILILGHLTYIFQGLCEIWDPKIDFSGMKKKYDGMAQEFTVCHSGKLIQSLVVNQRTL